MTGTDDREGMDMADKCGSDDNEMEQLDMADKCGSDDNEMEELSQLVAEPGTSAQNITVHTGNCRKNGCQMQNSTWKSQHIVPRESVL